ncbi:hypothetical protein N9L48_05925 [Psychrosphaera sp.]|nr:hypothetical protein [Psychrosphaera sp.]
MQEHGSFEINIIDQTIVVNCYGSWNHETVKRMCNEYKEHALQINDKDWACLVDLSQWELATPEMWNEIQKLNEWSNNNNQKFEAVICSLYIQKTLMEQSHTVLTNVETKFCDNIEQAYAWLNSVGVLKVNMQLK